VQWVAGDVASVCGDFDTVLQNPPFGVQRWGADRKFLKKALESATTIYSLHRSMKQDKTLIKTLKNSGRGFTAASPSAFLERYITKHGGEIKAVYSLLMTVPFMFSFHKKAKHEFIADLYIMKRTQPAQSSEPESKGLLRGN
jgi:putative methylase